MQTTARLITWHGCAIQGGQRYDNCKTEATSKAAIVDSHLLISILNQMDLTRFWTDINQYPGIHCLWETHDMFRNTALQETNRWKKSICGINIYKEGRHSHRDIKWEISRQTLPQETKMSVCNVKMMNPKTRTREKILKAKIHHESGTITEENSQYCLNHKGLLWTARHQRNWITPKKWITS